MRVFLVAAFSLLAVIAKAQEMTDEEARAIDEFICAKDESTKEAILQCVSLTPAEHFEILKECDTRVAAIEGLDYEKLLEIYCSEAEGYEEVGQCVIEIYRTRGIDEMEHIQPVLDCMKGLIAMK